MRAIAGLLVLLPLLASPQGASADPPPWAEAAKEERKAEKEQRKAEREWAREERKAEREWIREQEKAEREWAKDQREARREWLKAQREHQKELRKAQREAAREGWYDGSSWRSYAQPARYRDEQWIAIERYPAPRAYEPPPQYEVVVYEPGMRLPEPLYREVYVVEHHQYGLPPPPPRHRWVQVDDDAVLVAVASGLVADFVYDLFE